MIMSLSPSGWLRSLGWGVSHTGTLSPLGSILHVHQVDPQVLHVDPPFSLSSPTPLSTYVCLQDFPDTILLFSALYMPKPSQPGLPYFVRDARYSESATDIVISFSCLSTWGRESILAFSFWFSSNVLLYAFSGYAYRFELHWRCLNANSQTFPSSFSFETFWL